MRVFAFDDINLRGRSITATGQFPIAIVSRGNAVFDAPVIASGQNADGRNAGVSGPGLALGGPAVAASTMTIRMDETVLPTVALEAASSLRMVARVGGRRFRRQWGGRA